MNRVKGKTIKSKVRKVRVEKPTQKTDTEEEVTLPPKKGIVAIEVDEPEDVAVLVDVKPIEEALVEEEAVEDPEAEETGLDDDEVNPFGDKWEA